MGVLFDGYLMGCQTDRGLGGPVFNNKNQNKDLQ
jgi:hypothetical protein